MTNNRPQEPWLGFGIDVGGSGIKGALVDLHTGKLVGDRIRVDTPRPTTPEAVAEVIADITHQFGWEDPLGITLPSVIQHQIAKTAANIDKSWIDVDVPALFTDLFPGRDITVFNDADAAGLAEVQYGAARGHDGLVLLLTFGTGIGSAVVYQGRLVPNTEFGHCEVGGKDAEESASAAVRTNEDLSWEEWSARVSKAIATMEKFFWPDIIIAGGGISRKHEKWLPLLDIRTPIVPAELRNHAGIVGAAYAAAHNIRP